LLILIIIQLLTLLGKFTQTVSVWILIREVPGSNFGPDIYFSDQSFRTYVVSYTPSIARVRFPAWQDFSLLYRVQTGSGAHPVSCPMVTRGDFLQQMSTMNLSGGKGRRAREADNFTAIFEPIV
jgi:hypothetical protein